MSAPVGSVRDMSDKRRLRQAKQVRRDARRAKKRNAESSADTTFSDAIRSALARGHPLSLLSIASLVINVGKSDTLSDETYLDRILTALIGVRNRETTVLLAVIAELLVDESESQLRCRNEVAERRERVPRWITALPLVNVYRAVRRTNVFGDVDEVVVGMRLDGGYELTIAVQIDHNVFSSVVDAGVVPDPIDVALARVAESNTDTSVYEMTLADARAWIEHALSKPSFAAETDTWPLYRALVRWLVGRLPEGGEHRVSGTDWKLAEELCERFFGTDHARPFTVSSHRELLLELIDTGTGDPLRWSAARVDQAIGGTPYIDDWIPLEVALDAPDLLRAFIPFAHAQCGIRDELTPRVLDVVDELRSSYKRELLKEARYWRLDDAV